MIRTILVNLFLLVWLLLLTACGGANSATAHTNAGLKVVAVETFLADIAQNVADERLTVEALMTENREHLYHAAMMDPHTAAELDLDQIWALTTDLLKAHGEWLPAWARG